MNINGIEINSNSQTYFIADVAANHDGDIERAKDLIYLAAEAGANAAKFQHFQASTIVSKQGFESMSNKLSHQASWKKSVFEVYQEASVNLDWTETLVETCQKAGIAFFTTPYSLEVVDYIDKFVPAFKIGSGDITWIEIIKKVASKGKPYILATGASNIEEVEIAVENALKINKDFCLMQCNTNYTASLENFKYINLNVLNLYKDKFPGVLLGLSDHTPGHSTVLGAITLGAKLIEKHFTDDNHREGPDHLFSMNPKSWYEMVRRSRELELSLGSEAKRIEDNEKESVIVQRRSIRLKNDIAKGDLLTSKNVEVLRPCPSDALSPINIEKIYNRPVKRNILKGDYIKKEDIL
ncbi:N-acetylneuraminate synthase family protein [Prochlorococcus sp. MIT 1307]|uniref:N-acetylneuraminate synthase family protein n=1 Tax=Prochlorococcus sp. MIT 1307 TaxID=3096219 RepID=UPI002A74A19C|nr:N-acetylneuraminate synthase family protein [Prochlorococcus sp. MIT 1307]